LNDTLELNASRAPASHDRLVKTQGSLASIPFTFAALACTAGMPQLAPDPVVPPFDDARTTSAPSPPDTPLPPPPLPTPYRAPICTKVGCDSGVQFVVHLKESSSAITRDGKIHVCSGAECADGMFRPAPPDGIATCSISDRSRRIRVRCDLQEDEGGSLLNVYVIGANRTFVDGDQVALRVVAGGRRVVDNVRRVTYAPFFPNGPQCGGACRNATVELWPGSGSGVTCSNEVCDPVVRFTSTLPQTHDGAHETALTACKNGDCKTTDVVRLWRWDDVNERPIPESQGGATVAGIGGSKATVYASSGSSPYAPYNVKIEFRGDPRTYKDGDVFSIEWRGTNGTVLLSETRTVTTYDESHPGGPGCSPVTCKSKVF
jgi:hypothetical protein